MSRNWARSRFAGFLGFAAVTASLSCADVLDLERGVLHEDAGAKGGAAGSSSVADGSSDALRDGAAGQADALTDVAKGDVSVGDGAFVDAPSSDAPRQDVSSGDGSMLDTAKTDSPSSDAPTDGNGGACNPTNCPTGCCDSSERCVTSPSNAACGTGGARCSTCATGQECTGGVCSCGPTCTTGCCTSTGACVTPSDSACGVPGSACTDCGKGRACDASGKCVCNATSCKDGCCDATGACVPYASQGKDKCGAAGATCGGCQTGQVCGASGVCECTAASCANGCCDGATCVPTTSQGTDKCGSAGNACGKCATGQSCAAGSCTCGGTSCTGCCSNGSCTDSKKDTCGVGGGVCTACAATQECSAQGKCVCTPQSCPNGCCDANGTCVESPTASACGLGGTACRACAAGLACTGGQCLCSPTSGCSGCCSADKTSCVASPGQSACGANGAQCQACAQGQRCNGTSCVCDGTSCGSGCCTAPDGQCKTSSNTTCGTGGALCATCTGGLGCNGSSCVCTPGSCTTGCCSNSTTCLPFASQNDATCGAAANCGACAATQDCDKTNGKCACTAASCSTGCCSGDQCVPYGSQGGSTCGTAGAACGSCSATQKCNGSGSCIAKTWCELQTNPGVPSSDYQCLDFDSPGLPPTSVWVPTQTNGPILELVTDVVKSPPNAAHFYQRLTDDTMPGTAQLAWSTLGGLVSSVVVEADMYHRDTEGSSHGVGAGSPDYFCLTLGPMKACLTYTYTDTAAYAIHVPTGASGPIGTGNPTWDVTGYIPAKTWTHVRMELSSAGTVTFAVDGGTAQTCPTGVALNSGAATVQIGGTLDVPGGAWGNLTVDNVIAYVKR